MPHVEPLFAHSLGTTVWTACGWLGSSRPADGSSDGPPHARRVSTIRHGHPTIRHIDPWMDQWTTVLSRRSTCGRPGHRRASASARPCRPNLVHRPGSSFHPLSTVRPQRATRADQPTSGFSPESTGAMTNPVPIPAEEGHPTSARPTRGQPPCPSSMVSAPRSTVVSPPDARFIRNLTGHDNERDSPQRRDFAYCRPRMFPGADGRRLARSAL
jgi:hypothetical protein